MTSNHRALPLLAGLLAAVWFVLHFGRASGLQELLLLLSVLALYWAGSSAKGTPWLPLLVISAWAGAAALWSVEPRSALQIVVRDYVFAPMLWFAGYRVATSGAGARLVAALIAGLMALFLTSCASRFGFGLPAMARVAAFYPGPGVASTLVLLALPWLWGARKDAPRLSLIGALLALVAAAQSYNRMIWVALCGLAVLALLLEGKAAKSHRWMIVALIAFASVGVSYSVKVRFGTAEAAVHHTVNDPRLRGWQVWFEHGQQKSWLGWGTGKPLLVKTLSVQERKALERIDGDNMLGHGHNLLLNVFLQHGVVGVLLWGWLWATLLAMCWRARQGDGVVWANGALLLLAAALLKGLTDDFMDQSVLYAFWLMLGLLLGNARRAAGEGVA